MALSTHIYLFLFKILCCVFLDSVSAGRNNQIPSESVIEGDGKIACQGSSVFLYQNPEYPRDCSDVRDFCSSSTSRVVHLIKPHGFAKPFEAYCDSDIDASGWTVILRRFDGSVGFNRNWDDYKKGFGFLSTNFWLGNDKVSSLTNQEVYELRIDITLGNGTSCYLKYGVFRISDEWSNYTISTVGTYQSDVACRWKEQDNPFECNPTDLPTRFTDCNDVYNAGNREDGVYCISPAGWEGQPFSVFCNMSIDGGRWTVFQRRVDGSTNFHRTWDEYKEGFGDIEHEFWLGNEKLHHITQQATYEYRIDLLWSSSAYYNKYSSIQIDDEDNKYRLTNVGNRYGNKGHTFYNIQNTPFSTYDQDNDGRGYNCAEGHRSGWWHGTYFYASSNGDCHTFHSGDSYVICSCSNHNGDYNGGDGQNMFDHGCHYKYTEMKIRRRS